jgi:hypothetical protein
LTITYIYDIIDISYCVKRFGPNLIHIYLHQEEDKAICRRHFLSVSELTRGWIHEAMKKEGFDRKEPTQPKSLNRRTK